jgi:glycosyltransferase involved in cell wall biosynthesis
MLKKQLEAYNWPARPIESKPKSAINAAKIAINIVITLTLLLARFACKAIRLLARKHKPALHPYPLRLFAVIRLRLINGYPAKDLLRKFSLYIYDAYESARQEVYGRYVQKELYEPTKIEAGQPIASIIIPCFNYGQFIAEAIESACKQTISSVEIIVVDGGSTDQSTLDVLSSLESDRIKLHLREGRHLVGDNRNYGIARSNGRYICCLDADDTICPTYLEKAIFLLENYAYDCVSTSVRFIGAKRGGYGVIEFPSIASLTDGNSMATCGVFRRLLWDKVGGYRDTGIGDEHLPEDWDLWIRLAACGARFRNLCREPLFNYRQHSGGSLSTTNVRSILYQRTELLKVNNNVLTKASKELSFRQASRTILSRFAGGSLTQVMKNQVKIDQPCLFICIPYLTTGGAERLLATYSQRLSSLGWHIVIIVTMLEPQGSVVSDHWFNSSTNEVYHLARTFPRSDWNDFLDYLLESRQPRYLLLAGSSYIYERLRHIKDRLPAIKIVDFLFNVTGHTASNLKYKTLIDKIACESAIVSNWLVDNNGWRKQDIAIIKSSVDIDTLMPQEKSIEFFEKIKVSHEKLIVGFSGRMSHEKGPDSVLEIAKHCLSSPKIHFIMTGSGPLASKIQHDIIERGIENVTFLGHVSDVATVMANFDILILPSRIDGRPMVVLEALSMGIPVVASRVGGLPELVKSEYNGYLCDPGDYLPFAQHLVYLSLNYERLSMLKRNARKFAISNFNLDESTNALILALNS